MRYPYRCLKCRHEWDVIKHHSRIDERETCPECGSQPAQRYIASGFFYGEKVEDAEYNPAFGQVVRNKAHRRELAKQRGMVEIGNESPEAIHRHFDQERESRAKRRYDDLVNERFDIR